MSEINGLQSVKYTFANIYTYFYIWYMKTKYGNKVLEELVLYILDKTRDMENVGAVVLNKLLFYSDFNYFVKTKKSLTGEEYKREKYGIVPSSIVPVRENLLKWGKIYPLKTNYHGKDQNKYVPKSKFRQQYLDDEQLAFVDEIIRKYGHLNATQISNLNHREAIFQYAKEGETIPYSSAWFMGESKIPKQVIEDAVKTAKEMGYKFSG